jgi:hypothetical protein
VRWPGDACPTGYSDAQVTQGDGLDLVDPTGVVGLLLDQLRSRTDA